MSPVVMGVTSTVVYMLPFLSLPLTAPTRYYILKFKPVSLSLLHSHISFIYEKKLTTKIFGHI